jgi:hypothetical protein
MYSQDIVFSNNPKATLQGSISPTDTTAVLAVTEGAFPVLGANQGFTITFKDSATSLINEIVLVTGFNNATNTITSMLRGQENTTPRSWNSGDLANNLITAGYLNGLLQEQGALNGFLPVAGGTMTGEINYAQPITLASASAVLIGAAQSNNIVITGTTTITGFDSITAGATRNITFTGALTLTHSANLILPSNGQDITTAAGDSAVFQSLGSGGWKCLVYTRLNGEALEYTPQIQADYAQTNTSALDFIKNKPDVATAANDPNGLSNNEDLASTGWVKNVFSGTKATDGSQSFAGGLVIKWGYRPPDGATGTANITFPVAFPNNCFNVSVSGVSDGTTNADIFAISDGSLAPAGFTVFGATDQGQPAAMRFYWMAIGN